MDKQYIERPWSNYAYVCSNCKTESFYLFTYCQGCGTKYDVEQALEEKQVYPCISDLEEMRTIFNDLQGLKIRLWDYSVSHDTLQLRVAHCEANANENCFNTVIGSSGTERILTSTNSWSANLSIETADGKYGTIYKLTDKESDFLLEAQVIVIYQNMPAVFFS